MPPLVFPVAGDSVTVPSAAVVPSIETPASSVSVTLTPAMPGSSAGVYVPVLSTARITLTVTVPSPVCETAVGTAASELPPTAMASAATRATARRPGRPGRDRDGPRAAPFISSFVVFIPALIV
ncbi:hypothetical protein [Kitasatospora aureofaciens]|uniref:hypothetical protein n=1 Tax=Kitasatospora aureofaciens TaxID=1894 RepID=UPI00242AC311|nr:hypothetical protein [Kitasatospora aureofaciens]